MSLYILFPMMVLLPIVPAYILFKLLKSQGKVEGGKLYGFEIQLGGAFAGYFALLLVLLYSFKPFLVPPPTRMVWKLHGQVLDDKQMPVPVTSDNFVLMPTPSPPISTNSAGSFILNFIADPDEGSSVAYPSVTVSYRDYLPKEVRLDPQLKTTSAKDGIRWDEAHHAIYLPAISLSRTEAAPDAVHTSAARSIDGVADEYAKFGKGGAVAPPPGYSGSGNVGANQ